VIDPYRLAAHPLERICLDNPRPDESIALSYSGSVPVPLFCNPIFGVDRIAPIRPWQRLTKYKRGDSINPVSVDLDTTTLPQNMWLCLLGGVSGAEPPDWPTEPGVILGDYRQLTSDPLGLVYLLDNAGVIPLDSDDGKRLKADARNAASALTDEMLATNLTSGAGDIITDVEPTPLLCNVLNLLSDNGIRLFADSFGDGTVCWINLGIYPL
jgi:hypothetical protein